MIKRRENAILLILERIILLLYGKRSGITSLDYSIIDKSKS